MLTGNVDRLPFGWNAYRPYYHGHNALPYTKSYSPTDSTITTTAERSMAKQLSKGCGRGIPCKLLTYMRLLWEISKSCLRKTLTGPDASEYGA
jgi:hypothetical protein